MKILNCGCVVSKYKERYVNGDVKIGIEYNDHCKDFSKEHNMDVRDKVMDGG